MATLCKLRSASRYASAAAAAVLVLSTAAAQADDQSEKFRAGHNFMATNVYSEDDDQAILDAFDGLRVADVSDGMDFVGQKADKAGRRELYEQTGRKRDSSVQ